MKKLEDYLKYEQPTKYIVANDEYSDEYDVPVLTAGKSFVLGYTNEKDNIFPKEQLPVIIFDDFTTDCKYVDFPFKVKSSAMKILHPINDANAKFLYYYMTQIKFNNTLHKRYWISEYSQLLIKELSNAEQNNFVKKMNRIEVLINIRSEQIKNCNKLIKSQFVEMFGDPVSNIKKWKKTKLSDKCEIVTGNTPSRKIEAYYGNYIEWIKSDNIVEDKTYLSKAKEHLSIEGLKIGRYVPENCILMTCIAGSLKSIGNVAITDRVVSFNQQINGINPKENNVYFMYEQFILSKEYLHTPVNMSLKGILSKNQLGNLEFIFPPMELQNKFGKIFEQIDKQKFEFENSLKKLEELQASLMQEYFG